MKLSFTTLGCPDWDLNTILTRAVEYGYDAVDFRGIQGELNIYTLPEFSAQAPRTAKRFADVGLAVSCFSSSARLVATGAQQEAHIEEVKQYADLCAVFGTNYIRVFGGSIGKHERAEAISTATDSFQQMAEAAGAQGVTVILETHDDWLHAEHVKAVLDGVESPYAAVLWDVHHPYRMVGELPETTWQTLGDRIQYTHWKDSNATDGGHQLCLMGDGDIPLQAIADQLIQGGYTGYHTLEWEKKWHPELDEPEVAYPQYVQFMKNLLG